MNYEQIEAMVAVFADTPRLTEIEVRSGEKTLRLRRPVAATVPAKPVAKAPVKSTPVTAPAAVPVSKIVRAEAGLVGIFRDLEGNKRIVEGMVLTAGQNLGRIEAMRLLNDCPAPVAGTVVRVLVQDGQPVQYGQSLFEIEP